MFSNLVYYIHLALKCSDTNLLMYWLILNYKLCFRYVVHQYFYWWTTYTNTQLVSATPHTFVQLIHREPGSSESSIVFEFAAGGRVNHAARVRKRLCDFNILNFHRYWLPGSIQDVTECLDVDLNPANSQSKRLCFVALRIECRRTNFGCLREYKRVICKTKISAPDSCERHSAAPLLRHSSQYMVHASAVECRGKNISLTYTSIECEVVRVGSITPSSTLCTRIQAGCQFDELWGHSAEGQDSSEYISVLTVERLAEIHSVCHQPNAEIMQTLNGDTECQDAMYGRVLGNETILLMAPVSWQFLGDHIKENSCQNLA